MIQVLIRQVAERRDIKNPAELSRDVGVSKPTAAKLWAGNPANLSIETLDKICSAWKCKVDALIRYVPNGTKRKRR